MKTILTTLATVVVGLLAFPDTAEARPHGHHGSSHTYKSGHSSCGCAIYTKRIISSYDCYHRPVYRYYSVPVVHKCRSNHSYRSNRSHYSSGYRHNSYYGHRDRHYGHRTYGSHISFSTGYGNRRTCR
jgi:hypothetical protein